MNKQNSTSLNARESALFDLFSMLRDIEARNIRKNRVNLFAFIDSMHMYVYRVYKYTHTELHVYVISDRKRSENIYSKKS